MMNLREKPEKNDEVGKGCHSTVRNVALVRFNSVHSPLPSIRLPCLPLIVLPGEKICSPTQTGVG